MKTSTKVFVTAIKLNTSHYFANLLALHKILGMSLSKAKIICKHPPGEWVNIEEHQLISKHCLDDILTELDEYEINIEIKNLNQ